MSLSNELSINVHLTLMTQLETNSDLSYTVNEACTLIYFMYSGS